MRHFSEYLGPGLMKPSNSSAYLRKREGFKGGGECRSGEVLKPTIMTMLFLLSGSRLRYVPCHLWVSTVFRRGLCENPFFLETYHEVVGQQKLF
jgi:hypothetical protein